MKVTVMTAASKIIKCAQFNVQKTQHLERTINKALTLYHRKRYQKSRASLLNEKMSRQVIFFYLLINFYASAL